MKRRRDACVPCQAKHAAHRAVSPRPYVTVRGDPDLARRARRLRCACGRLRRVVRSAWSASFARRPLRRSTFPAGAVGTRPTLAAGREAAARERLLAQRTRRPRGTAAPLEARRHSPAVAVSGMGCPCRGPAATGGVARSDSARRLWSAEPPETRFAAAGAALQPHGVSASAARSDATDRAIPAPLRSGPRTVAGRPLVGGLRSNGRSQRCRLRARESSRIVARLAADLSRERSPPSGDVLHLAARSLEATRAAARQPVHRAAEPRPRRRELLRGHLSRALPRLHPRAGRRSRRSRRQGRAEDPWRIDAGGRDRASRRIPAMRPARARRGLARWRHGTAASCSQGNGGRRECARQRLRSGAGGEGISAAAVPRALRRGSEDPVRRDVVVRRKARAELCSLSPRSLDHSRRLPTTQAGPHPAVVAELEGASRTRRGDQTSAASLRGAGDRRAQRRSRGGWRSLRAVERRPPHVSGHFGRQFRRHARRIGPGRTFSRDTRRVGLGRGRKQGCVGAVRRARATGQPASSEVGTDRAPTQRLGTSQSRGGQSVLARPARRTRRWCRTLIANVDQPAFDRIGSHRGARTRSLASLCCRSRPDRLSHDHERHADRIVAADLPCSTSSDRRACDRCWRRCTAPPGRSAIV